MRSGTGRFALDPGIRVFVTDLRISWPRLLRRAGLPGDLLARGSTWLTTDDYYRLWQGIQDEAGDRDLTLDVGRAITMETLSPPIVAAMCSPTLAVAAGRIATYKALIGPVRLDLSSSPDLLRIGYAWPSVHSPPALLVAAEAVFWIALARLATRHPVRPTAVVLPCEPPDRAALEGYAGVSVHVGDAHAVSFTGPDAARPFLTENDAMWRLFAPDLRRRLHELEAEATVTDRVKAALAETLPAGDSTIGTVTRRLAMSTRTLQRQLREEGTTYQAVLAGTRADLARHYLTRSALPTAQIAYLLGYDDANSFYRAFRSWTGTTPEALRTSASAH